MSEYGQPIENAEVDLDRPIDPQFLNVDFRRHSKLVRRQMGCGLNPHMKLGAVSPIFEEHFSEHIIPQADWKNLVDTHKPNYSQLVTWQYDQDGEGTCTSNAESDVISCIWTGTFGHEFSIAPSPISMYRFCASGPNSGSSVACNIKRARDHGCLLIDNAQNRKVLDAMGLDPNHTIKAVGYNQRIPAGAMEETAIHFQIDEAYQIATIEGFFTALLLGFHVNYGRDSHAIHGTDAVFRSEWVCKYHNSWGQWGDNGYGYDTFDYIRRRSAAYGAWAHRSIKITTSGLRMFGVPELSLSTAA